MNTYSSTDGTRCSRSQIEARMRRTKFDIIQKQLMEHQYNFCQQCGRSQAVLDCAHKIPVKICLENGMAELAWDENNIRILCRECHRDYDNTSLQFNR